MKDESISVSTEKNEEYERRKPDFQGLLNLSVLLVKKYFDFSTPA